MTTGGRRGGWWVTTEDEWGLEVTTGVGGGKWVRMNTSPISEHVCDLWKLNVYQKSF